MTILYYSISKGLKFPPVLNKRGRPNCHDCMTLRLLAKRLESSKKPKSFSCKQCLEKERGTSNTEQSCYDYLHLHI